MCDSEAELYAAHIAELRTRYDESLEASRLSAVVIAAGTPAPIFEDDQFHPFKANPHLLQWGPLTEHPDSILCYEPGKAPELLVLAPADYWHQVPPVPDLILNGPINVRIITDGRDLIRFVSRLPRRTGFIGEQRVPEDSLGIRRVNPTKLLERLHDQRSRKTAWEVANIRRASLIAAGGHLAAEACFASGGSEFEIQAAFRTACTVTDAELPYPAIVATNRHASVLHYQRLDRQRGTNQSLLIDAGINVNAYASDISRTYSTDSEFGALIESMHGLQQDLCAAALPGADFRELHLAAHLAIAELLQESAIIAMPADEAVDQGVSRAFFPHGLGHFLGLQVHDVGALLANGAGEKKLQPETDPYLRLTRILEPGNVITVEPGLYFIATLLDTLRNGPHKDRINWPHVEELSRFGGIRIEDNVHLTASGNENLTRAAFSAMPS